MTLSDQYAEIRDQAAAAAYARIATRLEALERRLPIVQPRVVVAGTVPGHVPAPGHGRGPSREGLMIVDLTSRRLLVCAGERWWQAALKPAVPWDDVDPGLEEALARIAALDAKAVDEDAIE